MAGANDKLPPARRTPLWAPVTKAARSGEFVLPRCQDCATIQYPPREICKHCLGEKLEWQAVDPAGEVLAFTELHASLLPFFREGAPWPIGFVKLDCGPLVYAHLLPESMRTGARVTVQCRLDRSGQGVLFALPASGEPAEHLKQFQRLLHSVSHR